MVVSLSRCQDPWSLGDVPLNASQYADLVGSDDTFARNGDPIRDLQVDAAFLSRGILTSLPSTRRRSALRSKAYRCVHRCRTRGAGPRRGIPDLFWAPRAGIRARGLEAASQTDHCVHRCRVWPRRGRASQTCQVLGPVRCGPPECAPGCADDSEVVERQSRKGAEWR